MQRKALRERYRAKRNALTASAQQRGAQRLARLLSRNRHFRNAQHIAAYLASDGELDPGPLLRMALYSGKHVYLPALDGQGCMRFSRYHRASKLQRDRWGLLQPVRVASTPPPKRFDLVLLPLVAFDARGNRLGRGGGHYDRYFAAKKRRANGASRRRAGNPLLMGLAHSCQRSDALPAEPWDVPLDAIATERGIRYF